MNWRRGFLRLWAVLSVLWIGFAYLVIDPGHDIYHEAIVSFPLSSGIVVPLNITSEGIDKAISNYHTTNDVVHANDQTVLAEEVRLVKAEIADTVSRNASERRNQWQEFALYGAGVPAVVLLVGAVIAWIIAGFRARESRT